MGELFGVERESYPFELFSVSHMLMLAISISLIFVLYFFKNRIRKNHATLIRNVLIITLILSEVSFHSWFIINDRWDVNLNLPLQLCSISLYLCTFMLITKNYRAFEVAFFISMTGALIAIITPELFFGYPHLRFFQFFIAHIAIVLSCFYMLWVEQFKPTFKSVIRSFVVLNLIALFVFMINQWIGSNYMFLSRKPSNASVIDFLGPYPWYILSLEAVALILFTIIFFLIKIRKLLNLHRSIY
ncbi:TIGR02206 family membrane protein [Filobacillus milosensis]|uniref:TIGR02206 family membrane protein n=1 Tax=Filobacillus milosensis TaxID=94137 RepID=A0A4Y8IEX4_9BACI|nr:TIGR02206 family membrane protein [Filobacillus milosensis]TFB13368.1 TIGR02206 family membrane protein [Filobacillus milosensis]